MDEIVERGFSQATEEESEMPLTSFKKPRPIRSHEQKVRHCLMCREAFMSAWSGERICAKCKKSAAWRNALAES